MHVRHQQTVLHPISLGRLVLIGAAIGFVLIALFLFSVNNPNPTWPKYWMLRPLVVVPFAGAMAGVFYYLIDFLRIQGGWKKWSANGISFLVLLIGLWMGFVLGLDGTLWN